MPCVPAAQGSLPRGATHCTYAARVPASAVLYLPCTVAPHMQALAQKLEAPAAGAKGAEGGTPDDETPFDRFGKFLRGE